MRVGRWCPVHLDGTVPSPRMGRDACLERYAFRLPRPDSRSRNSRTAFSTSSPNVVPRSIARIRKRRCSSGSSRKLVFCMSLHDFSVAAGAFLAILPPCLKRVALVKAPRDRSGSDDPDRRERSATSGWARFQAPAPFGRASVARPGCNPEIWRSWESATNSWAVGRDDTFFVHVSYLTFFLSPSNTWCMSAARASLVERAVEAVRRIDGRATLAEIVQRALANKSRLLQRLVRHTHGQAAEDLVTALGDIRDPGAISDEIIRDALLHGAPDPDDIVLAFALALAADRNRFREGWLGEMTRRYGCGPLLGLVACFPLHAEPESPRQDPLSLDKRTDIPATCPPVPVRGVRSGIRGVNAELVLAGPAGGGGPVRREALCDILCELRDDQAGAHMSRMQASVLALGPVDSLADSAVQLARVNLRDQDVTWVHATVRLQELVRWQEDLGGRLVETATPIIWTVGCEEGHGVCDVELVLELPILNVCPCTGTYANLRGGLSTVVPGFSHVQPGRLRVAVRDAQAALLAPATFYGALRSVAHLRASVLKRPMEHRLVEAAFELPQFSEDLVRQAALATASICPGTSYIWAEAELHESIHPHQAVARVENWASHLWQDGTT